MFLLMIALSKFKFLLKALFIYSHKEKFIRKRKKQKVVCFILTLNWDLWFYLIITVFLIVLSFKDFQFQFIKLIFIRSVDFNLIGIWLLYLYKIIQKKQIFQFTPIPISVYLKVHAQFIFVFQFHLKFAQFTLILMMSFFKFLQV